MDKPEHVTLFPASVSVRDPAYHMHVLFSGHGELQQCVVLAVRLDGQAQYLDGFFWFDVAPIEGDLNVVDALLSSAHSRHEKLRLLW